MATVDRWLLSVDKNIELWIYKIYKLLKTDLAL